MVRNRESNCWSIDVFEVMQYMGSMPFELSWRDETAAFTAVAFGTSADSRHLLSHRRYHVLLTHLAMPCRRRRRRRLAQNFPSLLIRSPGC